MANVKVNRSQEFPTAMLLFLAALTSSCAYRLTNLHVKSPNQIETIAVESVFDTSGEVLPHEQLWYELQRAIAANGHLKLAPMKSADAILRAHINTARIDKAGEVAHAPRFSEKRDQELYSEVGPPLAPGTLRDISVGTTYYTKDRLSFVVDIEVIDLKTRQILLQRTYTRAYDTPTVSGESNEIAFVRHEESSHYGFSKVSRQIAETVVSDLLVR